MIVTGAATFGLHSYSSALCELLYLIPYYLQFKMDSVDLLGTNATYKIDRSQ